LGVFKGFGLPDNSVEAAFASSVEVVGTMVAFQLILDPVKREASFANAVCIASCDAAEMLIAARLVSGEVVESEHHIGAVAISVGDMQFGESRAAFYPFGNHPVRIFGSEHHQRTPLEGSV